ncbi:hypothetical protein PRIC2_009082 [Phytophthora ramorum]
MTSLWILRSKCRKTSRKKSVPVASDALQLVVKVSSVLKEAETTTGDKGESTAIAGDVVVEQAPTQREVVRMSRFRKSKLDHLVSKQLRDIALKADVITNLEAVVCDQLRHISHLTTTTRQQARVIMQYECHKSMLQSDLETTTQMLFDVRTDKQAVEFTLEQVRIDKVLQTNRAFQAEVAIASLRREFDKQVIANEDLMGQIWRKYEYDLYMRSLRRNKEVQATVMVADEQSQTLVPQRNPALERPRVTSLYIPADASGATETLLEKISRATRELLPGVANEMDAHFPVGRSKRSPKHQQNKQVLVRPLASSPRSSRTQLRAQVSQEVGKRRQRGKHRSNTNSMECRFIAISIVYEWLELASHRYVERLRKICDSPLTNVVNYLVQIVTSFYVCINWIVRGGSLAVSFSSWSIESLFLIATGVGYGIRWLAAKNKVTYVLQLHNLFDLLAVVAHFTISFQTIVIGSKTYRSWLDFGFIRSYVGYVVVDHLFTRYPNKTFFSQVLLGEVPHTNSFLLHVYECSNEDGTATILRATSEGTVEYPNCDETWSFFSSIYFMFVTVSTVGYGDFSPHTVLGQLTVCVIIVFGIYTFANESAAFMTLYGDQRGTLVKYDGSRNTVHVIVTGNPTVAQTKDFIREFFHPDH